MLSALDAALEAASTAPRTAAFQPKVKPRARKGGASAPAAPAAPSGRAASDSGQPSSTSTAVTTVEKPGPPSGHGAAAPSNAGAPVVAERAQPSRSELPAVQSTRVSTERVQAHNSRVSGVSSIVAGGQAHSVVTAQIAVPTVREPGRLAEPEAGASREAATAAETATDRPEALPGGAPPQTEAGEPNKSSPARAVRGPGVPPLRSQRHKEDHTRAQQSPFAELAQIHEFSQPLLTSALPASTSPVSHLERSAPPPGAVAANAPPHEALPSPEGPRLLLDGAQISEQLPGGEPLAADSPEPQHVPLPAQISFPTAFHGEVVETEAEATAPEATAVAEVPAAPAGKRRKLGKGKAAAIAATPEPSSEPAVPAGEGSGRGKGGPTGQDAGEGSAAQETTPGISGPVPTGPAEPGAADASDPIAFDTSQPRTSGTTEPLPAGRGPKRRQKADKGTAPGEDASSEGGRETGRGLKGAARGKKRVAATQASQSGDGTAKGALPAVLAADGIAQAVASTSGATAEAAAQADPVAGPANGSLPGLWDEDSLPAAAGANGALGAVAAGTGAAGDGRLLVAGALLPAPPSNGVSPATAPATVAPQATAAAAAAARGGGNAAPAAGASARRKTPATGAASRAAGGAGSANGVLPSVAALSQKGVAQPGASTRKKAGKAVAEIEAPPAKKPKIPHATRRGRRVIRDVELDVEGTDPAHLTLRNLIRRAEKVENMKAREELQKKREEGGDLAANESARERRRRDEQETAGPSLAPQVQVVNGRIVINEGSLTAPSTVRDDAESYRRVEEASARLNSKTYSNWNAPDKWNKEETERFYQGLRQFGSDFALIGQLFPGRTRRQLKSKYLKEDRLHKGRVDAALTFRSEDHTHYMELMRTLSNGRDPEEAWEAHLAAAAPAEAQEGEEGAAAAPLLDGALWADAEGEPSEGAGGTWAGSQPGRTATKLPPRRAPTAAGSAPGTAEEGTADVSADDITELASIAEELPDGSPPPALDEHRMAADGAEEQSRDLAEARVEETGEEAASEEVPDGRFSSWPPGTGARTVAFRALSRGGREAVSRVNPGSPGAIGHSPLGGYAQTGGDETGGDTDPLGGYGGGEAGNPLGSYGDDWAGEDPLGGYEDGVGGNPLGAY